MNYERSERGHRVHLRHPKFLLLINTDPEHAASKPGAPKPSPASSQHSSKINKLFITSFFYPFSSALTSPRRQRMSKQRHASACFRSEKKASQIMRWLDSNIEGKDLGGAGAGHNAFEPNHSCLFVVTSDKTEQNRCDG